MITPAAGFVGVGGALVMGLIGGVVCFWGITALKRLLKADDALDAFGLRCRWYCRCDFNWRIL